jgi:hypothetical protein
MNIRQNALNLLESYFKQTPKDQIEAFLADIDLMETNGTTFYGYLDSLDESFDYALIFDQNRPDEISESNADWAVGPHDHERKNTWSTHDLGKGSTSKIEGGDWLSKGMTTAA